MRREDRPPALAHLDQQAVLRQVLPALCEDALVTTRLRDDRSRMFRNPDRSRLPARTATTRDSAHSQYAYTESFTASRARANLLMRCKNKERHTLLATRSWSSTLLATQGRGCNAAAGEIDHSGIITYAVGSMTEIIDTNFSPLMRRYTLEELWALPEREDHAHYNLIAGYLFIVPPPEWAGC